MKKLIALLLACVMVLGLAACGGGNTPAETKAPAEAQAPAATKAPTEAPAPAEAKPYDGVTLTMWSMWNSNEPQGEVIAQAAEAFEAETGAHIEIVWKGRDINQILSASLEAGEEFDIFEDDYKRIGLSYAPYTYDLTEMAKAADYDSHSYPCINNQAIAWAGFLNSIAEQPQVGGVFYDKDAFATAGITAEPTTWAEYLDVCAKLKDAGIAPQALDAAYADFTFFHQLVRHLGEPAIEELSLNGGWSKSEGAVAAAQEVIDLVNAGYLADGAPDEFPASENKIGYGLAAMIVCANYVTAEVNNNTQTEVNWGLFNYPAVENGADNTAAYAGANSLAITKYCKNPQAAFDFMMFLTTGEWDQKMADNAKQIPADTRNTAPALLTGTIETLLSAESPMTWCASLNANDALKTDVKNLCTQIYEGKFATGADFCAAMDALY